MNEVARKDAYHYACQAGKFSGTLMSIYILALVNSNDGDLASANRTIAQVADMARKVLEESGETAPNFNPEKEAA